MTSTEYNKLVDLLKCAKSARNGNRLDLSSETWEVQGYLLKALELMLDGLARKDAEHSITLEVAAKHAADVSEKDRRIAALENRWGAFPKALAALDEDSDAEDALKALEAVAECANERDNALDELAEAKAKIAELEAQLAKPASARLAPTNVHTEFGDELVERLAKIGFVAHDTEWTAHGNWPHRPWEEHPESYKLALRAFVRAILSELAKAPSPVDATGKTPGEVLRSAIILYTGVLPEYAPDWYSLSLPAQDDWERAAKAVLNVFGNQRTIDVLRDVQNQVAKLPAARTLSGWSMLGAVEETDVRRIIDRELAKLEGKSTDV